MPEGAPSNLGKGVSSSTAGLKIAVVTYQFYRDEDRCYCETTLPSRPFNQVPSGPRGVLFSVDPQWSPFQDYRPGIELFRLSVGGIHRHDICRVRPGDIVFLSRPSGAVFAAAEVTDAPVDARDRFVWSREARWLECQSHDKSPELTQRRVQELLGHSLLWSGTVKLPYLNHSETALLLDHFSQ